MFLKPNMERSTLLPNILLITGWAIYLVNSAFVVFVVVTTVLC